LSYAVRNTIILLVTLTLFVGAAFTYVKFFQLSELEDLQTAITEKQKDFNSKKATSDAFPELNQTYQRALVIVDNADKSLFKSPDPDDVYDYLNYISNSSTSSKVYFDFVFMDSTRQDQYGILRADINGYGNYENVVNFINKIENSQLLNKVTGLSLTPPGGSAVEELRDITFGFTLESYYERISIQEGLQRTDQLVLDENVSTYNPFFPLIRTVIEPNEDNLVNIEQSRLIGLTGSRIFIVDQGGNVNSLRKGDNVYLGKLESIDLNSKSATFNLNKGGITELVTLEIER
jgi:Tfp pilus assembly protein PilO|tara:strand:- start:425 stop:1297 length:873 start_codon:yes stop_codon:yes gene_type:complete